MINLTKVFNMADKEPTDVSLQQSKPLSRKLTKILESRFDEDKDTLDVLKTLSGFFPENTLRARRNLRSDIERRSLGLNEDFLAAFHAVKEQLDGVYADVKAMNDCCLDMCDKLAAAKAQTHQLMTQTSHLNAESQKLSMKEKAAGEFLRKFRLTPDEFKILRSAGDGKLGTDFFTVFERVKQIHTDCKVLLRTNQQTAGLEIMEMMALQLESAYERLYRWTQGECRILVGDSPEISPLLCRAVDVLRDRPVLLKYCLDEYGAARRSVVVRGFVDALTRGGPAGTPRPIELHSHDPLRYTGDMMAWIHQAAASEKECLHILVPDPSASSGENILGHITEAVCRPFKVRVEQVLVSEQEAVTLYKLDHLLKFYICTMSQLVNGESALLGTIMEIRELSHRIFLSALSRRAVRLLFKIETPPADLTPSPSLTQTLQLLQDVLACHGASVVPIGDKIEDIRQILSCVMDPLLQACSLTASQLGTVDMAVYSVNCLHHIHSTLALHQFTDTQLEMLQAQIDAHLDTVTGEQAAHILDTVGLAHLYSSVQRQSSLQEPLSLTDTVDLTSMKSAMVRFDGYLANPDSCLLPQSGLIRSSSVRQTVKRRTVELVCQAYRQIYSAVTNSSSPSPSGKLSDSDRLLPRSPDNVEKLLL